MLLICINSNSPQIGRIHFNSEPSRQGHSDDIRLEQEEDDQRSVGIVDPRQQERTDRSQQVEEYHEGSLADKLDHESVAQVYECHR